MQKKGRLELTWAGKSYETESFEPRLLVEDKEKSYGDDSPNMLIHGDNLLALKALELDYMEAVQCIYIDPPLIQAEGQMHQVKKLDMTMVWNTLYGLI